jgi:hypothetical protein
MLDDIVGYQSQWHFHILVLTKRYFERHICDVRAAIFGIGILITLFHMNFDKTISAVGVVSSYG